MKKTITVIAAVMAVIVMTAFTDVDKTHWAYPYVERAYSEGLVNGMDAEEKIFSPEASTTKQQACLFVYKALCKLSPEIAEEDYSTKYAVILDNCGVADWAYKGVSYGFEKGYWDESDFEGASADLPIERRVIAKWVSYITEYKDYGLQSFEYVDIDNIGEEYLPYVDLMGKYGIMQGTDTGFLPIKPTTRAETSTVVVRLYDAIKEGSLLTHSQPELYISGVLNFKKNSTIFTVGEKQIHLSENAKLLVDGKSSDSKALESLNGKTISISSYLDGKNIQTVIVQSKPTLLSGRVIGVESRRGYEYKDNPHEVITIEIDGISADYVYNSDTQVFKNITVDSQVQFIADGIYLLEIE